MSMDRREFLVTTGMGAMAGAACVRAASWDTGRVAHGAITTHSITERFPPGHRQVSQSIWYENEKGERWYPDLAAKGPPSPPPDHPYQVSRLPNTVTTRMFDLKRAGHGDRLIMSGEASYDASLVLALVQRAGYPLFDAITIAAEACCRCMNSLAYAVGLPWGFPQYGREWQNTHTECEWCRQQEVVTNGD